MNKRFHLQWGRHYDTLVYQEGDSGERFIFECYEDKQPKGETYGSHNSFMEATRDFAEAIRIPQ